MVRLVTLILSYIPAYLFACTVNGVHFSNQFEAGRLAGCESGEENQFILHFKPEDTPINPSPWFYFSAQTEQPRTINVSLDFGEFLPRYLPKISHDKKTWTAIPFDSKGNAMQITLTVDNEPVYVAAQAPLLNDEYHRWLNTIAKRLKTKVNVMGKSLGERPIYGLTHQSDSKQWLAILGRQHPPELTGAYALLAFVDELTRHSSLSKTFLSRFNLLLIPALNVDGMAKGNWRHSDGHIDLNRDWHNLTQPETRLVDNYLTEIVSKGGNIAMAVDFHSTFYDVFYTIPEDADITPSTLVNDWLAQLKSETQRIFNLTIKPGNKAGSGVFKQYIADKFHSHGVTYEVGDTTPRHKIDYVAHKAARTLMESMLALPDEAYLPNTMTQKGTE
ncbi:M14-type cytosolic carboxypeptidase [Alteromonas sp. C1M14]|uniref:M14 family metallopeptidase n=1 Tax=Alteromonas sp. C1M14 TaxID=2841567 RepID=UPI001C0A4E2D|nr:M14-type cytosolic carboxypeptidase [Alteromonas sp. C1M14]MBU2977673.1 peptidase M14 [Alteromonas sp. C1M14]